MTQILAERSPRTKRSRPDCVGELIALSVRALEQMYRKDKGCFAHCIRRTSEGDRVEGVSRRYTAISLIGLASAVHDQHDGEARRLLTSTAGMRTGRYASGETLVDEHTPLVALGEDSLVAVTGRMLNDVHNVENLGDVALTLWAARAVGHQDADQARERLLAMKPWEAACSTVELAWAVTALCHDFPMDSEDTDPLERTTRRLMDSFVPGSKLFSHWPVGTRPARFRGHVCCFADLVYPTQALARYHANTGSEQAATIAKQCGEQMCALQGRDGQWWWHFDVRTGHVVEAYPVYAVHQDSMAPMALLDLQEACNVDHGAAIERGLRWLYDPTEYDGSLIDSKKGLVWRKVARHEPNKFSRTANALMSCIHPNLRAWGLGVLFRPGWVDWESRPYHFGWVLYAWCNRFKA